MKTTDPIDAARIELLLTEQSERHRRQKLAKLPDQHEHGFATGRSWLQLGFCDSEVADEPLQCRESTVRVVERLGS